MKTVSRLSAALVLTTLISSLGPAAASGASSTPPATMVNPLIPRLDDVAGVGAPTLFNELRKGGLVIFFRHAATDWGQLDTSYEDFENRAGQRNLSEAGKAEAAGIGKAFQELGIPIDSVFVSPMWRCRDTAQIAFGRYEKKIELFGKVSQKQSGSADPAELRAQYRAARTRMLSTPPTQGMNRVLVGQQDPMIPVIHGLHRDELREGDALVIRPLGGDKFKILAQVTPADWSRMAAVHSAASAPDAAGTEKEPAK